MRQNRALLPIVALTAIPMAQVVAKTAPAEPKQPNVIFIMSDDHTSQAIGVYGSRLAKLNPTPNIDRIGKEGIVMENAFVTNSISTPSRACIVSGQYSQTTGVLDLYDALPIERQNLPIEMKRLGYQTAVVGKWHLQNQPEMYDYYNVYYGQGSYFDPVLCEKGTTEKVKLQNKMVLGHQYYGHESDIVMDISLDWLKNKREDDKPFLLSLHFKAPHDNFEYNPKYEDYLADTFIPEPKSLWERGNHGSVATRGYNDSMLDTIGTSISRRQFVHFQGKVTGVDGVQGLSDKEYTRLCYQQYLKMYLRCVKGVDDNVARLFEYLEEEGLLDNTIIMYTGDQGFMLGEHDYMDKRWMYEESMRQPFLVRYPPRIKAGSRSDAIVNNVDYAGTIIDMAGGDVPEYMQGDSFKEILYNKGKEPEGWKQATYYRYWMHMTHHYNPGHFGIRTKDYKLIFYYAKDYTYDRPRRAEFAPSYIETPPAWEFYDLRKDPEEMNNLYDNPKYAKVISDLKVQLKQMRKDLNEEDQNYPEIQQVIDEYWDK